MLDAGSEVGAAVFPPCGRRVCPRAEVSTQAGCAQPGDTCAVQAAWPRGPAGAGGGLGCRPPGRVSWAPGVGVRWARGSRGRRRGGRGAQVPNGGAGASSRVLAGTREA